MRIAFFDFDGTITTKDSLEDFIQFAVGKTRYYFGLLILSPILVGYLTKLIRNDIAKQKLMSHFFKGWDVNQFNKVAEEYSVKCIDKIVRPKARERLDWHKSEGHKVVIVTASMDNWLKKWCEREAFELVSTRMQVVDNHLTGMFENKNCHGEEKVKKITRRYDLKVFEYVYAYGDTSGDKPMMSLANESFYREFE